MGKNGRDRLAEALEALKTLQDRGPCYAIKGMKTLGEVNSRMLLENPRLRMLERQRHGMLRSGGLLRPIAIHVLALAGH